MAAPRAMSRTGGEANMYAVESTGSPGSIRAFSGMGMPVFCPRPVMKTVFPCAASWPKTLSSAAEKVELVWKVMSKYTTSAPESKRKPVRSDHICRGHGQPSQFMVSREALSTPIITMFSPAETVSGNILNLRSRVRCSSSLSSPAAVRSRASAAAARAII